MAMTQAEWYRRQNEEQKERVEAAHELRMAQRRASMASDPGGFNPWEKKAVDDYYRQKEDARRYDTPSGDVRRKAEAEERVAEFGYMGQRDAGMGAAKFNAEASKYAADKTFAGVEAQAKSAAEIARQKAEAEKWIAGRNAEAAEGNSQREWGYMGADGNYVPGGRVRQAEAQGESAAKIAEANNATKLEQERIKAQAKVTAQQMGKDARVAAAIGGNPMLANNPEKARQMLESLAESGMSAAAVAAAIEAMNREQDGQGGGNPPPTQTIKQTRSQQIAEERSRRGMD